jgi:endoglucanase
MLKAWENFAPQIRKVRLPIPESGGRLPDFLAEVKWEMDWVLKMQADDGSAFHKVTTKRFGPFIPPEAETEERYFVPWGSEATAHFVGMTAQAARVFHPYDPAYAARCLEAAQLGYKFLKAHPGFHKADQTGFRTGPYEIREEINESNHRLGGIPQNRLWAEAELWETTDSPDVLRDLEARIRAINGHVNFDFDWDEVKNLGLLTYLFSQRPGRDPALVALVRSNVLAVADAMVLTNRQFGYPNPFGPRYGWGYNGFVARQTLVLMAADRLTRAEKQRGVPERGAGKLLPKARAPQRQTQYRAACLDALNYLFGRNYYGRSFVTGLGYRPPAHPHDRRVGWNSADPAWPGCLVGGPNPAATAWKDEQGDARSNEIAINWNAALIYVLAAFLE